MNASDLNTSITLLLTSSYLILLSFDLSNIFGDAISRANQLPEIQPVVIMCYAHRREILDDHRHESKRIQIKHRYSI